MNIKMKTAASLLLFLVIASARCYAWNEADSLATSTDLDEVTVIANNNLAKVIDGGFSYNMSSNKRAAKENLLQALNYVPLLRTSEDGSISIKGQGSYLLYLNGRPYEIAMNNPAETLRSIPASLISKIEVITESSSRFGPITTPIINIVTKGKAIDGYFLNIKAMGATNPNANGGAQFMMNKGKFEGAISYNYNLNGQRNQKMNSEMRYMGGPLKGSEIKSDGKGEGNWHSHTMRLMMKYNPDSLNSIYVDCHGLLTKTISTNTWNQHILMAREQS